MALPTARILVVDDDESVSDVIAYNLRQDGHEVTCVEDGRAALDHARIHIPDLIVLDLMLPLIDGIEICRRLRADTATKNISILMVTAKAEETDEVVGFSVGADDYVAKPFSVKVLMQRVKALLRRRDGDQDDREVLSSQNVVIDTRRHSAAIAGQSLSLTRTEFSLLETMVRQPGRVFSRAELISTAIGDSYVLERTVDVHIRALRKKLGDHANLIETVRGVGYRLHEPHDAIGSVQR